MKAIIFHGWGSTSKDNWFPWLKRELEKKNVTVVCPDLPNTKKPNEDEWLDAAINLSPYDGNTVLIGHSLGTILIMRLLEKLNTRIRAIFLVSSFNEHLDIPELMNFFEKPFDYSRIRKNAGKIFMLSSDNDPYIPLKIAERLSDNLHADLKIFTNMGHLSNGTNNGQFPELRDKILAFQ